MDEMTLEQQLEVLRTERAELLAKLGNQEQADPRTPAPKLKGSEKPDPSRRYVLLTKELAMFGKVPRQQEELGKLISANFEVGVPVPEPRLFEVIQEQAPRYTSLANSVQSPTHLFRYYRGLDKKNGRHLGFIQRGFLRAVDEVPAPRVPVSSPEVPVEFVG
jgi:hypothetical protein